MGEIPLHTPGSGREAGPRVSCTSPLPRMNKTQGWAQGQPPSVNNLRCPPRSLQSSCLGFALSIYTMGTLGSLHFSNFFFQPHRRTCKILVPQTGIERTPLQWKHSVLSTGQPGNSHFSNFLPWKISNIYKNTENSKGSLQALSPPLPNHQLIIFFHIYPLPTLTILKQFPNRVSLHL